MSIALFSRYMRSSVLDNITEDYVRTARAKGASSRRVLWRHVMRNSLIPIATLLGLSIPGILSGALITESVFNYPGMGFLFFQSAQNQDYPVMLGFIIVVAIATVIGSLLADIAYAVLDPAGEVRVTATAGARHPVPTPSRRRARCPRRSRAACSCRGLEVFLENKLAIVGVVLLVLIFGFCFLGPLFYHTDQVHVNLANENLPPGPGHPLGTDQNGYDVLGRLMSGGQISLEVGLAAALLATVSAPCGGRSPGTSAGSPTRS